MHSSANDRDTRWQVVLASASPRRKEMLTRLAIRFRVEKPMVDEETDGLSPLDLAQVNARRKARSVGAFLLRSPGPTQELKEAVLGVDTIVVLDGIVLGKPRDAREAQAMLEALSGRTHEVISGLHLERMGPAESALTLACSTKVTFRRLSRRETEWYSNTGEGLDKAGAYGIQDLGSLLVKRIDGCYFNVVGFPVGTFLTALKRLSIPLANLAVEDSPSASAWASTSFDSAHSPRFGTPNLV